MSSAGLGAADDVSGTPLVSRHLIALRCPPYTGHVVGPSRACRAAALDERSNEGEPRAVRHTVSVTDYLARRWEDVLELTIEHFVAVAMAVVIATVIGVLLAVAVYRSDRAVTLLLIVTNTLFTIPALAYFGALLALVGLGWTSAITVLAIYALLPIVRNAVTGLREVDPAIVRAATGMGMSRTQLLARVELPLAYPVILSGIRVSTVLIVGIAAIGAWVSGPGLGQEIFGGLGSYPSARAQPQITVGIIGIVLVALILDALLALLGRLTTPRGLR
jgi:osmoprotectant transport system permease protein